MLLFYYFATILLLWFSLVQFVHFASFNCSCMLLSTKKTGIMIFRGVMQPCFISFSSSATSCVLIRSMKDLFADIIRAEQGWTGSSDRFNHVFVYSIQILDSTPCFSHLIGASAPTNDPLKFPHRNRLNATHVCLSASEKTSFSDLGVVNGVLPSF